MPAAPRPHDPLDFLAREDVTIHGEVHFADAEISSERTARLRREEADAAHQRRMEAVLYSTVTVLVGVVTAACLLISLLPWFSPDDKRWANSLITMIVTAAAAYMTGKGSK